MQKNYKSRNTFNKLKLILGVALMVIILVGSIGSEHFIRHTYTVTVTDKQVKRHNDSDKYLVYARLGDNSTRVFEDTDSTLELKFNSADIYGELRQGKKYKVEAYGWRISFLSCYENIKKVEEIK